MTSHIKAVSEWRSTNDEVAERTASNMPNSIAIRCALAFLILLILTAAVAITPKNLLTQGDDGKPMEMFGP